MFTGIYFEALHLHHPSYKIYRLVTFPVIKTQPLLLFRITNSAVQADSLFIFFYDNWEPFFLDSAISERKLERPLFRSTERIIVFRRKLLFSCYFAIVSNVKVLSLSDKQEFTQILPASDFSILSYLSKNIKPDVYGIEKN